MSQAVIVGVEVGKERLDVYSRLGANDGPALAFEAPAQASSPSFWQTDAFDALLMELLALLHLPRIDLLVIALPGDVAASAAQALPPRYTGEHVVRNTECRSQVLSVTVQRVLVVERSAQAAVDAHAAAARHS